MNLNRHELIGHVGNDPYITNKSSKVAKISVATSYSYKKDGEWIKKTDWHTVVMFGLLADKCEKTISKGDLVYISGRHSMNSFKKEDEEKPTIYSEIIADTLSKHYDKSKIKESSGEVPF